ncbi:MAG: nucleotide sugar dehydrogenase [Anaerolineales bacterium]|jgi:UDP-N-acetyl-D-mannosaminuronic acid dehydrogenase
MMMKNLHTLLISPEASIREAMAVIESAPHHVGLSGIAVVVDEEKRLLGVVTDGDIRSAILHGVSLEAPVSSVMTRDPIAVTNHAMPMKMYESVMEMLKGSTRMLDRGAGKIVVVDDDNRVVDVVSFLQLWQQADIKTRKIAVLGLGFVGLTLAVVLADAGFEVLGVEQRQDVVESLQQGIPHFYEAGLANQLRTHVGRNLKIAASLESAGSDIYIISVGTPVDANNEPVLDYVEKASRAIGRVLKAGDTVMLRSTVPVGTTRNFCLPLLEQESGLKGSQDFSLVFAPERTIAGKAIKELRSLPQIVGALDPQGAETAAALYREITPTIVMLDSLEAAEMVKLVNNAFRDTIFSFANEIALVCEKYDLDAFKIIEAANEGYPRDPVPLPSPGVGGVCLKKDPYLLKSTAQAQGVQPTILGSSRLVNEYMPYHVFQKYMRFLEITGRKAQDTQVFLVGFAFKGWPETSDMRDSSTLELVQYLLQAGVRVRGFDPVIEAQALAQIPGVEPCALEAGFESADGVFLMNNHPSYEDWNLHVLLDKMRKPGLFVDGWRMFRTDDIARVPGISYSSVSQNSGWPEPAQVKPVQA